MTKRVVFNRRSGGRADAFTLLELLIVVTIIAALAGIIGTSLVRVRAAGQAVMCMNSLKTVTYEFFLFADDYSHVHRGETDTRNSRLFRLEDFQEKLYGIDEFWDAGGMAVVELTPSEQPLMCASAPGRLDKRAGFPCNAQAVTPLENVSVGFNMRLDMITTETGRLARTRLSSKILEHPRVPLVFDVDGRKSVEQGTPLPYYSTPAGETPGLVGTGLFWFPADRHGEKMNVAYIGGHVLREPPPPVDTGNRYWQYEPPLR